MTDYTILDLEDRIKEITESLDQMKNDMWFDRLLSDDRRVAWKKIGSLKKNLHKFMVEVKADMEKYMASPTRELIPGVITREPKRVAKKKNA
jgi:hypothetical protein